MIFINLIQNKNTLMNLIELKLGKFRYTWFLWPRFLAAGCKIRVEFQRDFAERIIRTCEKVKWESVSDSVFSYSATPWTGACQAALSREFSRQEYWNGFPFSSPGFLPHPGIKPRYLALQAGSLPPKPPRKPSEVVTEWQTPVGKLRGWRGCQSCW